MLEGKNIIVLDLETLHSADDIPSGWTNKPALGLSIGCYWDYTTQRMQWFDRQSLLATLTHLVQRQPLMVSFNGIGFDFPLMRGLLRQEAEALDIGFGAEAQRADELQCLCDDFKVLAAGSYDILAEIWKIDPAGKFKRGLNSLDAISQTSGLGAKLSHGAQAPQDWKDGRIAQVLNYCQDDVYKTRALFERTVDSKPITRGDGEEMLLPDPFAAEVYSGK